MANEIDLAAKSGRIRAASYEELYGTPRIVFHKKTFPAGRRRLHNVFLLASAAALAMLLVGQRDRVVKHLPATAGLYAAMGLPVNIRGLTFRNVKASILDDGPQKVLAVEGHVANIRNISLDVPDMRVAVNSPEGREIYSWVAKSPKPTLSAGEEIYFRARLTAPPEQAERIQVRFADVSVAEKQARK